MEPKDAKAVVAAPVIPDSGLISTQARLHSNTLLSIVIPCFNEEDVLPQLFERLQKVAVDWGCTHEVILVDDGSRDRTWEILRELHAKDPRWKLVRLGRNFGHQIALRAGLEAARGNVVAVLDADLQDPPEVVSRMLRLWGEGNDVVVGVRRRRKEGPIKRSLYYLFYRIYARVADLAMPLDAGDFCVMDRAIVEIIRSMDESRPFIRGLRSYAGFRQTTFPYDRAARAMGQTKYSYMRLFGLAADGILSNSRVPLHVATVLGAIVSLVAFLGMLLVFWIRLFPQAAEYMGFEIAPTGTATIIISVLFLGGVQLLCLGVVGAYIGRIYENVMRRPLWTIRETVGLPLSDAVPPREGP